MKRAWLRNYIGLFLLWVFIGSSVASLAHADWQSLYYRDHPFVGKVFSTQDGTWILPQQLDENIQQEQFILLGETHSNPDHHIGQANIIEKWLSTERPSSLVFEMLAYEDWNQSLRPEDSAGYTLEQLHEKLEQVSSQWDWEIYKPILKVQIKHQLLMQGANLTRAKLDEYSSGKSCQMTRQGTSFEFCDSLTDAQLGSIKQLIFDAHCGYLPLEHTQPLLLTQMAKDASFALSMVNLGSTHKVALIAGAVHIRKDIGVPVHLHRLGQESVSIAFINVDPDKLAVEDYVDHADLKQRFDYLYFTPSERNQDPCIEFAEQLKKMKKLTK
jgi:uncharacterized iron-regulated protein